MKNEEISRRIRKRLEFVYGADLAPAIAQDVERLIASYDGRIAPRPSGWSQRDAMLFTYGDSVLGKGTPLGALGDFLRGEAAGLFSFVHLLPFYPYTSDDGFSVSDFRAVRNDLGTWGDIAALARDHRLVFDGVINHVSVESKYMKGFCAGDPAYADFVVALPPDTDTRSVLRTRNLPLLHEYQTVAGPKWVWTTFSRDQVDLNYRNPKVLLEVLDVLLFYAEHGASMIRLDAIPYMWKELGTSCAHLPQTHELIRLIRDVFDAAAPHVLLLTETNVPHLENVTYFGNKGDEAQIIYNFTLAPLILWSLHKGNASVLTTWARKLEFISDRATYLNITATHDGIGVRPAEGILSLEERMELVALAKAHGGDVTGKRNADGSISPYELNVTYFDALNAPDSTEPRDEQVRRFLVSQAIPLCLMGIPGIYIHGLLGSRNDYAGVKATGRARSINRQQLDHAELRRELADPSSLKSQVLGEYRRLLLTRQQQTAFHPNASQEILDLGSALFAVRRRNAQTGQEIIAIHNVTAQQVTAKIPGSYRDLLGASDSKDEVKLDGYEFRWLEENSRLG